VYEELGSGQPVRSYTRFVEQGNDEETEKFYARDHWPAVRGGEKFADKAYLLSNVDGKEVRKRERKVIFSEAILSAVCERMKCEKKALLYARRGRGVDNRARGMAMKLCLEQGGMKLSEMGKLFNVSSDSAVSRSVSRIAGLYESICQDLTP